MKRRHWLAVFVAGTFLSACGRTAATTPDFDPDPTRPGIATTFADPAGGSPTPTARTSLEATDPTTVRLEGEGPLFVEFFAFW